MFAHKDSEDPFKLNHSKLKINKSYKRDEILTNNFKEILGKLKNFIIQMHTHAKKSPHTIIFTVVTKQRHQIMSPESPNSLITK